MWKKYNRAILWQYFTILNIFVPHPYWHTVPLSINLNCDVSLFKRNGYFWKSHKTLREILSHTHTSVLYRGQKWIAGPRGIMVPLEALWKADDLIWGKRKWEQKRTLSQMLRRYSICTEAWSVMDQHKSTLPCVPFVRCVLVQ